MKWMRDLSVAALAAVSACAQPSFEVNASGTQVTISPAGLVKVNDKQTQSFTVTPDAGYTTVSAVTGTCPAGSWNGNVYTTGRIVASCSVGFSAARQTFSVSPSGSNVTIAPGQTQTVAAGATQAFTVTADFGETTSSTVGGTCPAGMWSGVVYTTGAITSDCNVVFSAARNTYQVTPSGDSLEIITPSTPQTVGYGATPAFTVATREGYPSVIVGGTCPAGGWVGALYSTGPITGDCSVTFSEPTHQVTVSGDSLETITPSTPQTAKYGQTQAFTLTPDANHVVSPTTGGTCPAGTWSGAVYTTGAITADCTVSFTGLNTYQVTPSGDSNETIAPSTPQTVDSGLTQAFTVIGNHDWKASPTVAGTCPAGTWSGAVYTTGAITADCTVMFSATPVVVVTASSDANVSITPGGMTEIPPGSTQSFTVTPASGEAAGYIPGGTCPAGTWSGSVYTTGAITTDCSITFAGVTPVFQTATWSTLTANFPAGSPPGAGAGSEPTPGTANVMNVTGATDTAQILLNQSDNYECSVSAVGMATVDEIVLFAWDFSFTDYGVFEGNLEAFSDGPEGQTTVSLFPNIWQQTVTSHSGTTTLTLRAGYPFGFNVHGDPLELTGTLTVSTIADATDFQITTSGDSHEAIAPAGAVVRGGTTPAFTVTANAGDGVSTTVDGSCPAGMWGGTEYMPGPVTADCSLLFSGAPGTGNGDAGADAGPADAGVTTTGSTLAAAQAVCNLWGECDPVADQPACVAACAAGSSAACALVNAGSADGGTVDAGGVDGGTVDAGTPADAGSGTNPGPNIKLDTDPPFYTALDWTSQLWPALPVGSWQNLSANLSFLYLDDTLTFDSPPALDVATGDLTFATTHGTYGTAMLLATLAGESDAADGGLATATATFSITVNTPPQGQGISVRHPWKPSSCVFIPISVVDPDLNDWEALAILSPPQNGFLTDLEGTTYTNHPFVPEYDKCPGYYYTTVCYLPFSTTFVGSDSFAYAAVDDHGGVGTPGFATIEFFEVNN